MSATSGSHCSTPPKTGKHLYFLLTHCVFTVVYKVRFVVADVLFILRIVELLTCSTGTIS